MIDQHEGMHKEPYQAQCPCKEDTVQINGGKATCTNTTGRTAKDCLKTNFQAPRGSSATFTIATDYNQAGSSRRSVAPVNDVVTVCMEATFGAVHQFEPSS